MVRKLNDHFGSKCISFVYQKGGTGKTTACLNIAGWLTKLHQKALVIDLDPQANATTGLGVNLTSIDTSIDDVLKGKKEIKNAILETRSGVYLVPAKSSLFWIDYNLIQTADPIRVLQNKLKQVRPFFNFILIDTAPASSMLMLNAMVASKNIITSLDIGAFGYETLDLFKEILSLMRKELNIPVNVAFTFLKAFSSSFFHSSFTQQIYNDVSKYLFENSILNTYPLVVPFSKKICLAQINGLPISHYAPHSRVARAYKKVAEQILTENIILN